MTVTVQTPLLNRSHQGLPIFPETCYNKIIDNTSLKGGPMKEYDVIIIGSGAGANVLEDALSHNKTVALVDKGPLGGTCLNTG